MEKQTPIVAAFDFDGTLTYRDTLVPFIQYLFPWYLVVLKGIMVIPYGAAFFCGLMKRQAAKEAFISCFFAGWAEQDLRQAGEKYARERLPQLLRAEGLKRLQWHKSQGHRCVLVSASIRPYLQPWAAAVGFDDLICTDLELNGEGRVTGRLNGKNCWGPEKTRRLETLLGPKENYQLYAYGDSRGDQELLALADYPYYRKMPLYA